MSNEKLAFILLFGPFFIFMVGLFIIEWCESLKNAIYKCKNYNDYIPMICHIIATMMTLSVTIGVIILLTR